MEDRVRHRETGYHSSRTYLVYPRQIMVYSGQYAVSQDRIRLFQDELLPFRTGMRSARPKLVPPGPFVVDAASITVADPRGRHERRAEKRRGAALERDSPGELPADPAAA